MRTSERLASGWRTHVGMLLVRTLLAPLLRSALLISAFLIAVCSPQPFQVANAQDGGSGSGPTVEVSFVLDIAPLPEGRICLGHTEALPITPRMNVMVSGEAAVGRINVQLAAISTIVRNSSVVEATPRSWTPETAPNALITPFGASLVLTGLAAGSTTVNVTAEINTDAFLQNGEELVLPISSSSRAEASLNVQVVPCRYRVDILSIWPATLYNASAFVTTSMVNEVLTSSGGSSFSHVTRNSPSMRWWAVINRIRGCLVTNVSWSSYPPKMTAEISGDHIYVSLFYSRAVPDNEYYRRLCKVPSGVTQGYCPGYPDGVCWVKDGPPMDWFEPQVPTVSLSFPLTGGTLRVPQTLSHFQGRANGGMNITLTPLTP